MALKLNSVGGGVVTIDTPNTANNYTLTAPAATGKMMVSPQTLTVPDATGTVMVSGNMPAFSAWQSSAQTLSSSTWTKIQYQTEEYDTANAFDATTNYRFQPQVAGYYLINALIAMGVSNSVINLAVYKNGSINKALIQTGSASVPNIGGSVQIYLNGSTDYIEIYANINTGQALANSQPYNYFQASMVRTA